MIKQTNTNQTTLDFNFIFCPKDPVDKRLSPNNRWVRLADQVPCLPALPIVREQAGNALGAIYEECLSADKGAPSLSGDRQASHPVLL